MSFCLISLQCKQSVGGIDEYFSGLIMMVLHQLFRIVIHGLSRVMTETAASCTRFPLSLQPHTMSDICQGSHNIHVITEHSLYNYFSVKYMEILVAS